MRDGDDHIRVLGNNDLIGNAGEATAAGRATGHQLTAGQLHELPTPAVRQESKWSAPDPENQHDFRPGPVPTRVATDLAADLAHQPVAFCPAVDDAGDLPHLGIDPADRSRLGVPDCHPEVFHRLSSLGPLG